MQRWCKTRGVKAIKGKLVSIRYTAKNDAGNIVESSEGGTLDYVHGTGRLFPALEKLIEGRQAGDCFSATLEPSDAYGEHLKELTAVIDRSAFGENCMIKVGDAFHAQTPEGARRVRVTCIDGDNVTVDANHALAGVRLHFDVEVVSVSDTDAWREEGPSCSTCATGCSGCALGCASCY